MEKCVFIGYPQGYKGWKFYNPTTKKVVISERADFDERYFPMSKRPISASFPAPSAEVENTPSTTPAERYKGRLVAKGYNQRPGFDYLEIFAPTVRMPTIRVVLAMAAIQDLHLHSIDISHAYLNGEMDCDVYMEQPEGFAVGDPREMVCLLKKSIYGTKQGGNRWNQKMRSVLEAIGYTQSYSDAFIYISFKDNVRIILPVFMDDVRSNQSLLEFTVSCTKSNKR